MTEKKKTEETPQAPVEHAVSYGAEDRVVMASRRADGTPQQTAGFQFIGDKDDAVKGARHQLAALDDADVEANATAEVDQRHDG